MFLFDFATTIAEGGERSRVFHLDDRVSMAVPPTGAAEPGTLFLPLVQRHPQQCRQPQQSHCSLLRWPRPTSPILFYPTIRTF